MSASELRQLDVSSLKAELKKLYDENFKLKMRHGSGQLAQHHLLKKVKKQIARIKTIIHEMQRG